MLMGLKRPLREGERIPIRLFFEGNREALIELRVERR
jgi:copper(I)-binding protein